MQVIIDKWRDMSRRRSFSSLSSTSNLPTDISKPFHSTMPPSVRIFDEPLQGGLNSREMSTYPNRTFKEAIQDIIYHGQIFIIRFYNYLWDISIAASLYLFSLPVIHVICVGYVISLWLGYKL